MATIRKEVLTTGEIYHVFNRGVERRSVFTGRREYERALETINYYRFSRPPIRYSHFINLNDEQRQRVLASFDSTEVTIIAYCLMPNHFHFILRQEDEKGISQFVSNFTNSYSRYFNTKNERVGPLFQGTFKAVRVETDEQLWHLSRYVHLNPVISFLIKKSELNSYPWSSFHEYLESTESDISEPSLVLKHFKNVDEYRNFVHDQIRYAQELERIKHLALEE